MEELRTSPPSAGGDPSRERLEDSPPLDGVLVVAVEQAIAAPLCTRHLADLGARVIKVERPGVGDFARGYDRAVAGLSSQFLWVNRGKESLALDLKADEGRAILERLLARADVFVENLRADAARGLGLTPEAVRRRHPHLVVASIRGFGPDGPNAEKKAYDLLIQAEAGVLAVTGTERDPAKVGISVADIAAGMYALSGILAALIRRKVSGKGQLVQVSLFDALAEWMGYPLYYARYGGMAPKRTGMRHATIAPYGPVATAEGTLVFVAVQNDREWQAFCRTVLEMPELTGHPHFQDNPSRVAHREELEAIVAEACRRRTAEELEARLDAAGIAHARLNDVFAVLEHPELVARARWQTTKTPVGEVATLLAPWNGLATRRGGAVPDLGADTEAILAELGIGSAARADLIRRGVVGVAPKP